MKKQSKDYSLLRFLGLAFLRKEFLKSRAGLQDDRPEVSRSSTNPALLPLRSTQRGEGTGVSLGIQGRCSWKCLFAFYHAFRENFREHLIAPELKRNDSFFVFFLQAGGTKQQCYLLVVNSHQLFCPLPQLETPLFIVTQ